MFKDFLALTVATGLGSGMLRPIFFSAMAGTYGSLLAISLCYGLLRLSNAFSGFMPEIWIYAVSCSLVYVFGVMSIPRAELVLGARRDWRGKEKTHDQNQIVIDEVFGMMLALAPLLFFPRKVHPLGYLVAFAFFRLFDIAKFPPPVRYFDRWKTPAGVMLDDGVAGAYAAAGVVIILLFWNQF